jgi:WD40 repeat protein
MVSGSLDKSILLWDIHTGDITGKIEGHTDRVRCVTFNPKDDSKIASASADNTVRVWDAVTGTQLLMLRGHTNNVWSVSWSPDGRYLVSGSSDTSVRVWDCEKIFKIDKSSLPSSPNSSVPELSSSVVLSDHKRPVMCVRWNPLGKWFVSGSLDFTANIYEVSNGGEQESIQVTLQTSQRTFQHCVFACEWSPSGRLLAAGGIDGIIRILSESTEGSEGGQATDRSLWKESMTFSNGNTDHIGALAFNRSEDLLMCGSYWGHIYVWDLQSKMLAFYSSAYRIVYCALFSPHDDSIIAISTQSSAIELYRVTGISDSTVQKKLVPFASEKESPIVDVRLPVVCAQPVHYLSDCVDDSTVVLEEIEFEQLLRNGDIAVCRTEYSPDGQRLASAAAKGEVVLWDLVNGRILAKYDTGAKHTRLLWSVDGTKIACCSEQSVAYILDGSTLEVLQILTAHTDRICGCFWFGTGTHLVTVSVDNTMKAWDLEPEVPVVIGEYSLPRRTVHSSPCIRSPTCISVAYTFDYTSEKCAYYMDIDIVPYDDSDAASTETKYTVNWRPGDPLGGIPTGCSSVRYSPDGTRVLVGCINEKVYVWEISPVAQSASLVNESTEPVARQPLLTLVGHGHVIYAACFSRDGTRIISGDRTGLFCCWDAHSGQLLQQYRYAETSIWDCDWNPTRGQIAVALLNGSISILDQDAFIPVTSYYVSKVLIRAAEMSPCGKWVAGGYHDGLIRLFSVETLELKCELNGHKADVSCLVFSKNGERLLSGAYDGRLCYWTFAKDRSAKSMPSISLHSSLVREHPIRAICWSPDERYFCFGGHGNCLEIVDAVSLLPVGNFALDGWLLSAVWSPCGQHIAATTQFNKAIVVYTLSWLEDHYSVAGTLLEAHDDHVFDVDWNPCNNLLLSTSLDHTLRVWDPTAKKVTMTLDCSVSCPRQARWSRDGSNRIVSCCNDNAIRLWDLDSSSCICELFDHTDFVFGVRFWGSMTSSVHNEAVGPENSVKDNYTVIVSCSADGTIRLWDSVVL